jgi:hypothetical protein
MKKLVIMVCGLLFFALNNCSALTIKGVGVAKHTWTDDTHLLITCIGKTDVCWSLEINSNNEWIFKSKDLTVQGKMSNNPYTGTTINGVNPALISSEGELGNMLNVNLR